MSRLFRRDSTCLDRVSFVGGVRDVGGSSSLPPFGGFRFQADDGTSADMAPPPRRGAARPVLRRRHSRPAL